MSIVVRDDGFHPEDWQEDIAALDAAPETLQGANAPRALDVAGETAPEDLEALLPHRAMIRVTFPAFSDGRGFTLAQRLRRMGFAGRLRATGHVLADQFAMARRCGFDEVEIDDALAARQPEPDWLARSDWRAGDYQSRLRG